MILFNTNQICNKLLKNRTIKIIVNLIKEQLNTKELEI